MKRMIIDTEAVGPFGKNLVYDVGAVIVDENYFTVTEYRALVKEVFEDTTLMQTAYYADKLPGYYEDIAEGKVTVKPFAEIYIDIVELLADHNVKEVWAHNAGFDKKALNYTLKQFLHHSNFMPKAIEWHCIQAAAASTICQLQRYYEFVTRNNMLTTKGKVPTNAQAVYSFLINNPDYNECHTALNDARDESIILRECKRRHVRKSETYITSTAWQRPQAGYEAWLKKSV